MPNRRMGPGSHHHPARPEKRSWLPGAGLILSLAAGLAAHPVAAQPYTITDLGPAASPDATFQPYGLNNLGQIVGQGRLVTGDYGHAILLDGTGAHDLGTLTGRREFSGGNDINQAGWVVGWSRANGSAHNHAFLYRGGALLDLGTLGGFESDAFDVNSTGQIVGMAQIVNPDDPTYPGPYHAFLWENGMMRDLGTLGGTQYSHSAAFGINDAGQVVGRTALTAGEGGAFLWQNGVMQSLGTLPGYPASKAVAVNSAGSVIGVCESGGGQNGQSRSFLYEGGVLRDLGSLGGRRCEAASINGSGQIVGWSYTAEVTPTRRAFLYQTGAMADLNNRLPAGSGWVLQEARKINDRGQIVGIGLLNGEERSFLLSPPQVLPPSPPRAPGELTARVVSLRQIDLQWTDGSSDEHGFEVEYWNGSAWTKIATTHANITSFSHTSVGDYGRYRYRVRAVNAAGGSDWSSEASTYLGPTVVLSQDSLTFGEQRVGTTSSEQRVSVTNGGNASLSISSIRLEGPHAEEFTAADVSGFVLAPGQTGIIRVRFAPRAAGSRTAALSLTTDAEGSPHILRLSGTAIAPLLNVSISRLGAPGTLNFGPQALGGAGARQTLTLTNAGNAPLAIGEIRLAGAHAAEFAVVSDSGGSALSTGATRTITLGFTPQSTGQRTATLTIASDAPGSPHTITLNGSGVLPLGGRNEPAGQQVAVRDLIPTAAELNIASVDGTVLNSRQAVVNVGQPVTLSLQARFRNGAVGDVSTDTNTRFLTRPALGQFTSRNVWVPRTQDAGRTVVLYGRYYSPYSRRIIIDHVTITVRPLRSTRR